MEGWGSATDQPVGTVEVTLTLDEALVRTAACYSVNLHETIELLLRDYVSRDQPRTDDEATALQETLDYFRQLHETHGLLSDESNRF